jgi:ribulose-phosphate 3-epimerase
MIEISASLLAADYARLAEDVERAERAGVDSFHFDFMDGHYVPNLALTPQHIHALRPYTSLPFTVHLEVSNTDQVLESFEPLGADTIIVQADTCTDFQTTADHIRKQEARVGLAVNPDYPLHRINDWLPMIDLLLILGVTPGFGGQPMHTTTIDKIAEAHGMAHDQGLEISIAVDGGVKLKNAGSLVVAGANILILGTGLFEVEDMEHVVNGLREFDPT